MPERASKFNGNLPIRFGSFLCTNSDFGPVVELDKRTGNSLLGIMKIHSRIHDNLRNI